MQNLKLRSKLSVILAALAVCSTVLGACRPVTASTAAAAYRADVAVAWFDLAQELVRATPGYTPPVAARALGYMGVTLYETVQPGMAGYHSLAGQLNELKELPAIDPQQAYHWPAAANSALAQELFPTAPPAYSEEPGSAFYREAMEVYETVSRRDPQEMEIALFWADEPGRTATPPGHWAAILGQVLVQEEASLALAAEAYAQLGIALADAFITCWYTKYVYHVPRPITYIQNVIDVRWNAEGITDPVKTPPFPEYTSGHSVQSSAAALVLTSLFGEHYAFTDRTNEHLGLAPRSFGSFAEAAEEAARSRLYGGIHYRAAIKQGLLQGRCVGEHVLGLVFKQ